MFLLITCEKARAMRCSGSLKTGLNERDVRGCKIRAWQHVANAEGENRRGCWELGGVGWVIYGHGQGEAAAEGQVSDRTLRIWVISPSLEKAGWGLPRPPHFGARSKPLGSGANAVFRACRLAGRWGEACWAMVRPGELKLSALPGSHGQRCKDSGFLAECITL